MKFTRDDLVFAAVLAHRGHTATVIASAISEWRETAGKLHRFYELCCNFDPTPAQTRRAHKLQRRALELAKDFGIRLAFNADPRGFPLRFSWAEPTEHQPSNNMGGEDWGM